MKKLIIYMFIISNQIIAQDINNADKIMDHIYNRLINTESGSCIEFTYSFKNEAYEMKNPIYGKLSLFSNNRFHLEFNREENKMIQIYNGDNLKTILIEEEEIQIDNMETENGLVTQSVFSNYKSDFNAKIIGEEEEKTIIQLKPKKTYHQSVFNDCIEKLELPHCLKLPNQCKIGIHPAKQEQLNDCLYKNNGYKETNIVEVQVIINSINLELKSIIQTNRYNGEVIIDIKDIKKAKSDILSIQGMYDNFEIIDLR